MPSNWFLFLLPWSIAGEDASHEGDSDDEVEEDAGAKEEAGGSQNLLDIS